MKYSKQLKNQKVDNKHLNTFEGWKKDGRFVIKGEKAHGFNHDGKALFRKDQTDIPKPKDVDYEYQGDYEDGCWVDDGNAHLGD